MDSNRTDRRFNRLTVARVDLGKGKRSLYRGGRFDPKYRITVPKQEEAAMFDPIYVRQAKLLLRCLPVFGNRRTELLALVTTGVMGMK